MHYLKPVEEIQNEYERFERESENIDDLRYQIGCLINILNDIDTVLIDRSMKLESVIEIFERSFLNEPVAFWTEIHRLGF